MVVSVLPLNINIYRELWLTLSNPINLRILLLYSSYKIENLNKLWNLHIFEPIKQPENHIIIYFRLNLQ